MKDVVMQCSRKKIAIIATMDTKAAEASYFKEKVEALGESTLLINSGVFPSPKSPVDIDREAIGAKLGMDPAHLPDLGKTGAMQKIAEALREIIKGLYVQREISAVVCLGGGVGMWIGSHIMQDLPIGFPKVIISPIPFRDIKPLLGTKDIILVHSVVDLAGLNPALRELLSKVAASVVAMTNLDYKDSSTNKVVGLTVKGITQKAGDNFRHLLEKYGFEVMAFHASGMGGKAMEESINGGIIDGVIDLTTQELTGEIFGGTTQVDYQRFYAAGKAGIPQLICPGAIETLSFGPIETLSKELKSRPHYCHSPSFTHVRITQEEMITIVKILAERLNHSEGPTAILIPRKGFSVENREGSSIYSSGGNDCFGKEIKKWLRSEIQVYEADTHIDDPKFAEIGVQYFLRLMKSK